MLQQNLIIIKPVSSFTAVWSIVAVEEVASCLLPPSAGPAWAALLCFPHDWVSCCYRNSEGHIAVASLKLKMSVSIWIYRTVMPVARVAGSLSACLGTENKFIHRSSSVKPDNIIWIPLKLGYIQSYIFLKLVVS